MGDTVILAILAIAGVCTILLFAVKGVLDQLPGIFESWHRARRAWRGDDADDGGSSTQ
ncbi:MULTISPECIES: hypothetical protein [unclassified Streptomyces]|uniref:hypothetical protein n=1 Tax=unclassified Streptomyces TaxID=2593676 RepID=UPI003FD1B7A7